MLSLLHNVHIELFLKHKKASMCYYVFVCTELNKLSIYELHGIMKANNSNVRVYCYNYSRIKKSTGHE